MCSLQETFQSTITDINNELDIDYDHIQEDPYDFNGYVLSIYNKKIDHPDAKFIFYIEKAKVISYERGKTIFSISYSDKNKKMIEYIERLENEVCDYVSEELGKKKFNKRTFSKNKFVCTINKVPIFNFNDELLADIELKKSDIVSIYLEQEKFLISKKYIWIEWKILQIKLFEDIDYSKSLFVNVIKQDYATSQPSINIPPPPPPIINNSLARNSSSMEIKKFDSKIEAVKPQTQTQTQPKRLEISADQLINQLKKLKKVNSEKSNEELIENQSKDTVTTNKSPESQNIKNVNNQEDKRQKTKKIKKNESSDDSPIKKSKPKKNELSDESHIKKSKSIKNESSDDSPIKKSKSKKNESSDDLSPEKIKKLKSKKNEFSDESSPEKIKKSKKRDTLEDQLKKNKKIDDEKYIEKFIDRSLKKKKTDEEYIKEFIEEQEQTNEKVKKKNKN
jgi:hypothetical protein